VFSEIENGISIHCIQDSSIGSCTFRNVQTDAIPTLSEWGLIAMAGILLILGLFAVSKRKVTA